MGRLLAAAVVLTTVAALAVAAPGASSAHRPAAGNARCKLVVKKIHGHRRKVKVCKKKPKPKPPPKPKADLAITVTSTLDQVTAGNRVYYTIELENKGPAVADDVVLSIDLPFPSTTFGQAGGPDGLSCDEADGKHIHCTAPQLQPPLTPDEQGVTADTSSFYLSFGVAPDTAGSFAVTARVTTSNDTRDPQSQNNVAKRTLSVLPGPATADLDLSLTSAPDPASVKEGFTETVTVKNAGPSEVTDAAVTVLLPPGVVFNELPGYIAVSPEDIGLLTPGCEPYLDIGQSTAHVCFATIHPGETKTSMIHLTASIHSPPTLESHAVVAADTRDLHLENNQASVLTTLSPFQPPAGVDLVVALGKPSATVAGQPLVIPFSLRNLGLGQASNVTLTADAPGLDQLGVQPFLPQQVDCISSNECTIGAVPSDRTVTGVIYSQHTAAGHITVTLRATSASADADPADNAATVGVDVSSRRARR